MPDQIIRIARRFCGPPDSGNGGNVAGMLAKALGGSGVEVTLMAPPPLDRDLVVSVAGDSAELRDGERLIAVARRAAVEVEVGAVPSLAQASAAEVRFSGFEQHNFPGCFVCGPERAQGDGLRIFPGALDARDEAVVGVWQPDSSLGSLAVTDVEFVWAALDCAGYFAVQAAAGMAVLGRIAVEIVERPAIGQPVIVTGWGIAHDGRKHRVGTALHDRGGGLIAKASATWITIG